MMDFYFYLGVSVPVLIRAVLFKIERMKLWCQNQAFKTIIERQNHEQAVYHSGAVGTL